jgi:hypothetical protein
MKTALAYLLLCMIALAGRAAYVIHDRSFDHPRRDELERAAISLARHGSLANVYSETSGPSAHVAPLYPLLLAGLYRVFGWDTVAAILAQEFCAVAVTTAGFMLLPTVARKARLSVAAGWAAAYGLALLPVNLWVETTGGWEQPYSALALLGLFLCFCRLQDEHWHRPRTVLLTGLLLGVIALLSPSLLPAGALMTLAEFGSQRADRRRVVAGGLLMALVAGLLLAPWVVRNYLTFGHFIPFRSNFGLEFALGNNPQANGMTYPPPADGPPHRLTRHPYRDAAERAHLAEVGEWEYMHEKQSAALSWVAANPGQALRLTARRFRLFWFPPADVWPAHASAHAAKAAVFDAVGFGALACLAGLVLVGHPRRWLLAGSVIGPSLIYVVTHVDPRYRYPVFGLTALLSAQAVFSVGAAVARSRRTKRPERKA